MVYGALDHMASIENWFAFIYGCSLFFIFYFFLLLVLLDFDFDLTFHVFYLTKFLFSYVFPTFSCNFLWERRTTNLDCSLKIKRLSFWNSVTRLYGLRNCKVRNQCTTFHNFLFGLASRKAWWSMRTLGHVASHADVVFYLYFFVFLFCYCNWYSIYLDITFTIIHLIFSYRSNILHTIYYDNSGPPGVTSFF